MRSEIHTVNLIRASSYIRQLISTLLGSSIKPWETELTDDLLLRLRLKESLTTLAEQLDCAEDEVFKNIVARADALVTEQPPLNFTLDYLRELDRVEVHSHLTPVLQCDPWDVLDELLDVHAMLETLFEVAPEMTRHLLRSGIQYDSPFPLASEAVRNILLTHRRIEEHFGIDEYGWGRVVDGHNWLKSSAIDKLLCFCAERGIIQRSGASLLAAIIQNSASYEDPDVIRLDTLAVIHIQQRINWIVRQLHERAEELAHMVSTAAEESSLWAQLEHYLKFYELNAPASAWRMVVEPQEVEEITTEDAFRDILLDACADFSREIIQGLILAGIKLPSRPAPLLDESLSASVSIKPMSYDQDLVYPVSHSDVIATVKNEYLRHGNVRLIE